MLFTTIDFILFLLIVLSVIAIVKHRKFQHLFLLICSYFFYYYSGSYFISLLIFSTLLDYYVGKEIWQSTNKTKKKFLLIASLGCNLGLLGFFKYVDFTIEQINTLGQHFGLSEISLLNLGLPIGISFYTFQTMSYTIDVYRGNLAPSKSLTEFALFVTFFPQLVAGPIIRARDFLPQLREKISNSQTSNKLCQIIIHNSNLKLGLTIVVLGFFKKMFFADNIAPLVNNIFSNPIGLDSFSIIIATIAFGIQIYCDFSGYSDIAIGTALILGFKFIPNFNKPFFATSPSDFWSRWHISLSSWVRDYLYFPLVFKHRRSDVWVFSSLLVSMLLMGLWHGAGWNFLIWGGIHGVILSSYTIIRKKIRSESLRKFFATKLGIMLSIFITQYFVFLSFIAFRVKEIDSMLYSIQKYVFLDFSNVNFEVVKNNELSLLLVGLFVVLHIISYKKGNLSERLSNLKLGYWFLFLTITVLLILLFYGGSAKEFIYFEF